MNAYASFTLPLQKIITDTYTKLQTSSKHVSGNHCNFPTQSTLAPSVYQCTIPTFPLLSIHSGPPTHNRAQGCPNPADDKVGSSVNRASTSNYLPFPYISPFPKAIALNARLGHGVRLSCEVWFQNMKGCAGGEIRQGAQGLESF